MKDFLNKKNIINLLLLGIMIMAIPLTAKLARQQQILFSHAAEQKIEFLTKDQGGSPTPDNKSCVLTRKINGADKPVSLCKEIKVKFTAPTGADLKFVRTSLLPQEGFIKKAYAQSVGCCSNGYKLTCDDAGNGDCWEADSSCDNIDTCSNAPEEPEPDVPAPAEPAPVDPTGGDTGGGTTDGGNTDGDTSGGDTSGGGGSRKGQTCEAGYNQQQDDGTIAHCTPGECSNDDCSECAWDGNGDGAGPATECTGIDNNTGGGTSGGSSGGNAGGIGVVVGQGGCCATTADCKDSNKVGEQSTQGWTCDDHNDNCSGGKACKAPAGGSLAGGAAAPKGCYICDNSRLRPHSDQDVCGQAKDCSQSLSIRTVGNDTQYICKSSTNKTNANCDSGEAQSNTACVKTKNTLTFACGSQAGSHSLTAKWNITKTGSSCNVYVRAGLPGGGANDIPVNRAGACIGERTFTGSFPNGNVITNDGRYQLFVSNGNSCNNELAEEVALNCASGGVQKCFACEDGKYRFAGTDGALSSCPSSATACNPANADTCKSSEDLRTKVCNTGGSTQKCFVCRNISGQNKWVYPGANESGSGGNENATCSDTENSCDATSNKETCKGPVAKLSTTCVGMAPQITKIRFSDDRNKVETAEVKNYQDGGKNIFPVTFADNNPGQKFVWVQFGDNNGNWTEAKNKEIFLAGPDPLISGAACNLDLKDNSLKFQVIGDNFGDKDASNSKLAADTSNLEIKEWTNQKVIARFAAPPDTTTGKTFTVNLTRSDGVKTSANCSVNTTQISLGAKLFCRAPRDFDQDNVKLLVVQNALGIGTTGGTGGNFKAGDKQRETVTITKDGVINLKTKLQLCGENGQDCPEYKVCLKAPKSVRVCSKNKFKAINGNMIIQNLELPLCDTNDDGICNSTDASRCKAEWGPGKGNKSCEFNRDNVTNSFEWGCLIHDFNRSDEEEPS